MWEHLEWANTTLLRSFHAFTETRSWICRETNRDDFVDKNNWREECSWTDYLGLSGSFLLMSLFRMRCKEMLITHERIPWLAQTVTKQSGTRSTLALTQKKWLNVLYSVSLYSALHSPTVKSKMFPSLKTTKPTSKPTWITSLSSLDPCAAVELGGRTVTTLGQCINSHNSSTDQARRSNFVLLEKAVSLVRKT